VEIPTQLTTVYTYDASGRLGSLLQTAFSGVAIEPNEDALPEHFALHSAYPNPFNPSTTLRFDLPEMTQVRMELFDVLGRSVQLLVNDVKPAGHYQQVINAETLSTGTYFAVLTAQKHQFVRALIVLK